MYRELPPPDHLRGPVACLWVRTPEPSDPGATAPTVVVPDGCTDIMGIERGPSEQSLLVAGPDDQPMAVDRAITDTIVGVRFRPGRATALGVPLGELRNQRVDLAELWGSDADRVEDRVAGAPVDDRLAALVAAVSERIQTAPAADLLVADVVRRLVRGERPAVADLADDLGVSERQLRRRTTDALGYGPTTFARIVRFQRALDGVRAGESLSDVAATTGFADQAHLTREVRALAGATPGAIARAAA